MELDREKIQQQLRLLNREIEHLISKKAISLKDYIANIEVQYFIERAFQRAIEVCINIGNHIISRKGLAEPGSFSDVFRILGKEGIIPLELSEKFIYLARFRNKLVHLYWEIEPEEVHKYLQNNAGDLERFYKTIVKFIETN